MDSIMISSKLLTKTDLSRLSMQASILTCLPPFQGGRNAFDLELQDEEGEVWTCRLIIRRGKYKKPVLSAGWARFVKSKQLQIGFKLEFFKEVNEATGEFRLKIKLKKPVRLFNYVLVYSPYRAS